MQPIKSNISTNGKCVNPVTTKCVVWDGPEITCLDGSVLCKGQLIETTVYTIATKLCEIYDKIGLTDINTCINNSDDSPFTIDQNSSIQDVFSAIIFNICTLQTKIEILENKQCQEIRGIVPNCLVEDYSDELATIPGYDVADNSLPIEEYARFVANIVCAMLISISSLKTHVDSIKQNIQNLWDTLNNCSNNCNFNVQPTCTNDNVLNPSLGPVFISTAYEWLEAKFCELQGAVGTPDDITNAIEKQCANLENQDRLSSGGVMGNIGGWVSNPISLSDSLTNMWLTVCDMRQAVQQILNGCCFSLCSYLEFGYDITWSQDGTTVFFSVNTINPTVYNQAPPSGSATHTATPSVALPAWATTQFPTVDQTPVIITFDDGQGTTGVWNTGLTLNQLAVLAAPLSKNLTTIPGYQNTSNSQNINIQFNYKVDDGVNPPADCEINQTDSMPFECCNPYPVPYDWGYTITSTDGTNLEVILNGVIEDRGIIQTGTVVGAGANTLTDTGAFNPTSNYFLASRWGAIVEITSGAAAGDIRYITNAGSVNTITVNQNWSAALAPGDTYIIRDRYWLLPFVNPNYPCSATSNPLIDFKLQIIQVNPSYDPNDSSTWDIVYQVPSIDQSVIFPAGFTVPSGTLVPNTQYAVALFAQYACDYSNSTLYSVTTPLAAIVSIQVGAPGSPLANVFQASTQVIVDTVVSDGVAQPDPGDATVNLSSVFPLTLPTGLNKTSFEITPTQAAFVQNIGTVPGNYAICGLLYDPWAQDPVTGNYTRDTVLGLYRGYQVSIFRGVGQNQFSPVLDICSNPYQTNSLDDPGLAFIFNRPPSGNCALALPCTPLPFVPVGGCASPGSPIEISIPSNYTLNTVPIIVRYDPTIYPVNRSVDYHKVTMKAGSTLTINNTTGVPLAGGSFNYVQVYFVIYTWDASAPGSGWVKYIPTREAQFKSPNPLPAGSNTYTLAADIVISCKYGDAVNLIIETSRDSSATNTAVPVSIAGNKAVSPGSFFQVRPIIGTSGSKFSCNNPSTVDANIIINPSAVLSTSVVGAPSGTIRKAQGQNFFVTEDFDIEFKIAAQFS